MENLPITEMLLAVFIAVQNAWLAIKKFINRNK